MEPTSSEANSQFATNFFDSLRNILDDIRTADENQFDAIMQRARLEYVKAQHNLSAHLDIAQGGLLSPTAYLDIPEVKADMDNSYIILALGQSLGLSYPTVLAN